MSKPRADEDDEIYLTYLGIGNAHHVSDPEAEEDKPVGRLIVPDPEQRHGWREHYVKAPRSQRAPARVLGFRPR